MKHAFLVVFFLFMSGCQPEYVKPNPFNWQPRQEQFFQKFVNSTDIEKTMDRENGIRLINTEYPIEMKLFKDGKFKYHLDVLGEGEGDWAFKEGQLQLYAERTLFVMNIGIHSIDQDNDDLAIDFVDRFGTQFIEVSLVK